MRFWDYLFLILVVCPVLTGGLWLKLGNARVEYTQPGPAAAILALWLWLALRKGANPSKIYAKRQEIFAWWIQAVDKKYALFVAWILVTIWWFLASLARHNNFQSNAIDLGIFTNAIWNLAFTGSPYSAIKGGASLLADHQNFVIFPIALFFKMIPRVETLLFIQAIGLASTGLAIFYLAKQRTADRLIYLFPLAFWAYAPIRAAIVFDFHPEVLMLPLFLFAAVGVQSKNHFYKVAGLLLFCCGILSKESGGPVAVGLGLAWLLGAGPTETKKFTRIFGGLAILLGVFVFWFDTKMIPEILGFKYYYENTYAPFGSSILDLLKAPFVYPIEFFSRLFALSRWKFFIAMLAPFAFLPLFAPAALLASAPGFLMLFLTTTDQRVSLGYHYAIEPAVGVLFALCAAMGSAFVIRHRRKFVYALPLLALIYVGRSESYQMRIYSSSEHLQWLRKEIIPNLNSSSAIAGSSEIVPHMATRHWVHYLPIIWIEGIKEFKLADCVLWEQSTKNIYLIPDQEKIMRERLATGFVEEFTCRTLHLYKNKEYAEKCLVKEVKCGD